MTRARTPSAAARQLGTVVLDRAAPHKVERSGNDTPACRSASLHSTWDRSTRCRAICCAAGATASVVARAPAATPTPTRGPEPRRPLPLVRQISWGGRRRARRTPGPSALSRRRPDHAAWPPVASARRRRRRLGARLALATGGQVAWSGRRRDRADGSGVRPARRRPPQLIWRTKGSGRRGSGRRVGVGAAAGALATTDAVAPAAQQMARQRAERSHVEWSEAERHAGVSLPDRSTLWGAAQSTTTMANWKENGAARERPFSF